jgi:hypothetical protein
MHVLTAIAAPPVDPVKPVMATGKATSGGVDILGVHAVLQSAHGVSAWARVLDAPESVESWQPPSIGTRRADRIDLNHLYQQMDVTVLWGAVHFRRQVVVAIDWLESTPTVFRNCWHAVDHEPYRVQVAPWAADVPWLDVGHGGWVVRAAPGGGSVVAYQFWTEAAALIPQVQSWAMSRTLPELMAAFETRVGEEEAAATPSIPTR